MLRTIHLQNFRSYKRKVFNFSKNTVIIGRNTAGKTNLIEAIFLASTGDSFKTEKDTQAITFDEDFARVTAETQENKLEVLLTSQALEQRTIGKKFFVNGVSKRRIDFIGHLPSVLFSPADLEIVIESPGIRRRFLNEVLEQSDRDYRVSHLSYLRALRQRNALLDRAADSGHRNEKEFEYWDRLLIESGQEVTAKREDLINFINDQDKDIFDFSLVYDKSTISTERLLQYKDAELGSRVTLVGPHRDDFIFYFKKGKEDRELKLFGSRGQQRLAILELRLIQLLYMEEKIGERPLLLLDDIFSELDSEHIKLVLTIAPLQQTIITTTHEEFIDKPKLKHMEVLKLENGKES